jgi:cytochrome c-type biogenesis protein CcmH/NrfG
MTSWKGLTATGVAVVISKENEQSQSRQPEQNIEPIEQRLGVLEDLKSRGLISEEEYMDKRNKILGDI